jgi:hypothetical protein
MISKIFLTKIWQKYWCFFAQTTASFWNNIICSKIGFCEKLHFFKKEVARGGERTRVFLISSIFTFFTTLPLSHIGSPKLHFFGRKLAKIAENCAHNIGRC